MPRAPQLWRQDDFSGGMVQRTTRDTLLPNEVEWLQDFVITESRHLIRRNAFVEKGSLLDSVAAVQPHVAPDGTVRLYAITDDGDLWKWDVGTETFSLISTGEIPAAPMPHGYNFVSYHEYLIVLPGGAAAPVKIDTSDDSVSSVGGSPPAARYGAIYFNHLFLAGIPGEETRIYHSETADIDDGYASKNYFFNLSGVDNGEITGLLARENELIVSRDRSITRVTGYEPRDFSRPQNVAIHSPYIGARANSLVDIDGTIWFLGRDGIYSLAGGGALIRQSWAVDGLFRDWIPHPRARLLWRPDARQLIMWPTTQVQSHPLYNKALVGYPGQGRGGRAAWSLWTMPDEDAGLVRGGDILNPTLGSFDLQPIHMWYGESIYELSDASQADASYSATDVSIVRTGPQDMDDPFATKLLRQMRVEFRVPETTTVSVSYETDDGTTQSYNTTLTAGSDSSQDRRFNVSPKGRKFWLEVKSQDTKDCQVMAVEMTAFTYGRKTVSQS